MSREHLPPLSNPTDFSFDRALAVLYSVIDVVVTPFHQHFALQNYTLQYPYAVHERVPIALALAISGLGPILAIALYTLVVDGLFAHRRKVEGYRNVYKFKDRLWELNCGILGLLLAQGAAFVITGTMKNLVGKPRPDLIDRCQPRAGSVDPPVFGLSSIEICTQTSNAILTDGMWYPRSA
jgi:diacylglycerol diphosphate phosphatase/phosphatidate phosphatase